MRSSFRSLLLVLLLFIHTVSAYRGGNYYARDPTNAPPITRFYNYTMPPPRTAIYKCALITIVMDESASMESEQEFLRVTAIPNMTKELYSPKYDYDFVFICSNGFGRKAHVDLDYYRHLGCTRVVKSTNRIIDYRMLNWQSFGSVEDGYSAIQKSVWNVSQIVRNINLNTQCKTMDKNMIFVTDEDRDYGLNPNTHPDPWNLEDTIKIVQAAGYVLNIIIPIAILGNKNNIGARVSTVGGHTSEIFAADGNGGWRMGILQEDIYNIAENQGKGYYAMEHYAPLVIDTQGAIWSHESLRLGTEQGDKNLALSFASAFIYLKVNEVACTNLPAYEPRLIELLPTSGPTTGPTNVPTSGPTSGPTAGANRECYPCMGVAGADGTLPLQCDFTIQSYIEFSNAPSLSPSLSAVPSETPTLVFSEAPSAGPSVSDAPSRGTPAPTYGPTSGPTSGPTTGPSGGPTSIPTSGPSSGPTSLPTSGPSSGPTTGPSGGPTSLPTSGPSSGPTSLPTSGPSSGPTTGPSGGPTSMPTSGPSGGPTSIPTSGPSSGPTPIPTSGPSSGPTSFPTSGPSSGPTSRPSSGPTTGPSGGPTSIPTSGPSGGPTSLPTSGPSSGPTSLPTSGPSSGPTSRPSSGPTTGPSGGPTSMPTSGPSGGPTSIPTSGPSSGPTSFPTSGPSSGPTSRPSSGPTTGPSGGPTSMPTSGPSSGPTSIPTSGPSSGPTSIPTSGPSSGPTSGPSSGPTSAPTVSCRDSDCEAAGPAYYSSECGSSYCLGDQCTDETLPGADCTTTIPTTFSGNPCYIGPKCSLDGLSCDHTFESEGTSCVVPGEDPSSFDAVCVDDPVCTPVSNLFVAGYMECIRPVKVGDSCTLPEDPLSAPTSRGVCHGGDFCTELGKCEPTAVPSTTVCREAEGCCDEEEYCPGDVASGFDCPEDLLKAEGSECRSSCPDCPGDQVEVCDGLSKSCPSDVVFADELCILAGQHNNVGYLSIEITIDSDGNYILDIEFIDMDPLADVGENVKIYVGLEPPPSSPGSYNIKGSDIDSVVHNLSTLLDYSPCDDSNGFYIAVHFDMADGETAWALPCDEKTSFMDEMASGFCKTNIRNGKQRCSGWGKYFNVAPCCPSEAGCADTCPESGVAAGII